MKLCEKIFELRKKMGMSQECLAEKIGVSRQSVSKWETGESVPEIEKILLLSKIFSVSTDYLLNDELNKVDTVKRNVCTSESGETENVNATAQPSNSKVLFWVGIIVFVLGFFLLLRALIQCLIFLFNTPSVPAGFSLGISLALVPYFLVSVILMVTGLIIASKAKRNK